MGGQVFISNFSFKFHDVQKLWRILYLFVELESETPEKKKAMLRPTLTISSLPIKSDHR